MESGKYMFMNAKIFEATVTAFQIFVDEYWNTVNHLYVENPEDPYLDNHVEEGHALDTILRALKRCPLTEKDTINRIFANDYLLLSDNIKDKFSFGYADPDSELH